MLVIDVVEPFFGPFTPISIQDAKLSPRKKYMICGVAFDAKSRFMQTWFLSHSDKAYNCAVKYQIPVGVELKVGQNFFEKEKIPRRIVDAVFWETVMKLKSGDLEEVWFNHSKVASAKEVSEMVVDFDLCAFGV